MISIQTIKSSIDDFTAITKTDIAIYDHLGALQTATGALPSLFLQTSWRHCTGSGFYTGTLPIYLFWNHYFILEDGQ